MTAFLDIHPKACNCSYCGNSHDKGLRYGLNIPPAWREHNAWYTLKFGPRHYFRMTHGLGFLARRTYAAPAPQRTTTENSKP